MRCHNELYVLLRLPEIATPFLVMVKHCDNWSSPKWTVLGLGTRFETTVVGKNSPSGIGTWLSSVLQCEQPD